MKRSRRLREKKEQETVQELIPQDWQRGANTKGLPILPDELLLEILAYYPPIPLPTLSDDRINTAAHIARRDMMLSLSRSCSNLRRFFHPYIWERIEVCAGMSVRFNGSLVNLKHYGGSDMEKAFAEELIRQLEIVTVRDPTLAQYVKIVNIRLSKFAIHRVLIELGRCFDLFINLHTTKIVFEYNANNQDTGSHRAFRKYIYPSVQNVILSSPAFPLIQSCPNLRIIQPCGHWNGVQLSQGQGNALLNYTTNCLLLEKLLWTIQSSEFAAVARALPSLTEFELVIYDWTLRDGLGVPKFQALSQFTRLDKILVHYRGRTFSNALDPEFKEFFLDALRTIQERDKRSKSLRIFRYAPPSIDETILPAPEVTRAS